MRNVNVYQDGEVWVVEILAFKQWIWLGEYDSEGVAQRVASVARRRT